MARKTGHFKTDEAREEFYGRYDAVGAHWPVPATEVDIETRYGPTHVRRSGDPVGSPIVLLHPDAGTSVAGWRWVGRVAAD